MTDKSLAVALWAFMTVILVGMIIGFIGLFHALNALR